MAALAGDEPSYYSSEDVAPTYEQRRQAAVLAAADARAESGLDQAQRQNARDTDLFGGGAAARERAVGDIQDEATKRQARTQGEIYFDPLQQRMQRARFQEQMDMLDKRFVEGQREKLDAQEREASEKAATTREANALKASTALDVERLRGDSRNTSAGTRAQGQVDAALVKQGKPVTPAASELPEKTFTEKSLAKYAADTGQSLAEAAMELKGKGYKWVGSVPIIQAIVPR